MRRFLSTAQRRDLTAAYVAGEKIEAIAERFGIERTSVMRIAVQNGAERRPARRVAKAPQP